MPFDRCNTKYVSFQQKRNIVREGREIEGNWRRDGNQAAESSFSDAANDCLGAGKAASASIIVGEDEIAAAKIAATFSEKIVIGKARQEGQIVS